MDSNDANAAEQVTRVINGRYELLTQIGEGGMSRVFVARDLVLNKMWAAKEIKRTDDTSLRSLIAQSIVTEANMIKRFDHPAIPRIVDIIDEEGTLFVIMDLIEGKTLEDVASSQGPQNEDTVVDWALQLCDVLEYLHQRTPPVIYRDMKPSNVMLKPNGLLELVDFGIAREYRGDGTSVNAAVSDTSQLGTRGFAPPEQYGGGGQTDARSDVYALGATLYTLLTGKNPAEPPYSILPVRQVIPELSLGIESIIATATQPDPDDRYQDCAQMAYALSTYREHDAARLRRLRRRWRSFVGVCVAAVLSLGVGVTGIVGSNIAANQSFDHWEGIGEQSSDENEAVAAYARAAQIKPGSTAPLEGMIARFKADSVFSTAEESKMRDTLLPHLSELERAEKWPDLAFSIGKLYWYSFDPDGSAKLGNGPNANSRSERIRAAAQWMEQAAQAPHFSQHDLAQAYADIAEFNTNIVPLINEGSDKGQYKPYCERLVYLMSALKHEENDVIKLEAANLALDAVRTYPRKFRADGISSEKLASLVGSAEVLANTVSPTTDYLDAEKTRVVDTADAARQAVKDAYTDVEA